MSFFVCRPFASPLMLKAAAADPEKYKAARICPPECKCERCGAHVFRGVLIMVNSHELTVKRAANEMRGQKFTVHDVINRARQANGAPLKVIPRPKQVRQILRTWSEIEVVLEDKHGRSVYHFTEA